MIFFSGCGFRRWVIMAGLLLTSLLYGAPLAELKVMSFNIWVNGGDSLSDCIEAIRSSGADLVGLQECNASTAQTIGNALGFYVYPAGGCSIVNRYPIVMTHGVGSARGITVEPSPGQRLHLFNCHLAPYPYGPYAVKNGQSQAAVVELENETRLPALRLLLKAMQPYLDGPDPCFLTGDFNAPSHLDYTDLPWPTSVACVNAGLKDSYRELHAGNRQFPPAFAYQEPGITWTPKTVVEPEGVFDRIDFVYFSGDDGVAPVQSTELDGRNSVNPWPSDHRAVITTFALTPPELLARASRPFPAHQATNVTSFPVLGWLPGSNATHHAVYWGTNGPGELLTNTTATLLPLTNLLPGTTYYWRVDESTPQGTVAGEVWSFSTAVARIATYEWNFAYGDLSPALGNGVLAYADGAVTANLTTFGTTDGTLVPHIHGQPAKYLHAPAFTGLGNGYLVTFADSEPNGGGAYINQYTMIFDVLLPGNINWFPFFNTNPKNANDADFYVSDNGALGIGSIGYTAAGLLAADTWYRVAFAADLAAGTVAYYLNGNPVLTGSAERDGRHAIYSNFDPGADLLLFNEGDTSGVYTHAVYLSSFCFIDRTLSAAEIQALGGPKAAGILAPQSPIILSIALDSANVMLNWTGGAETYQLQKKTRLSDPDWQNIGAPTRATNAIVPREAEGGYFRVRGQ